MALLVCLCALYISIVVPFTNYMKRKPFTEKLGTLPTVATLKFMSADQKLFVGSSLILKVIIYFGGLTELAKNRIIIQPDYPAMSRIIHSAVKLDPYNIDAYYFAQAFLTWEAKQYTVANELLEYGMNYRTWDWYLPFFAGFNYAYFLKDYKKAALCYKHAGELSGSDLSKLLAGRYMQESGQTELAINYLSAMLKRENNTALKKNYQIRLNAFSEARRIEIAYNRYKEKRGVDPVTVEQLISAGFLSPPPRDPYGGQFYLDASGRVSTTSKYAFAGVKKNNMQKSGVPDERH